MLWFDTLPERSGLGADEGWRESRFLNHAPRNEPQLVSPTQRMCGGKGDAFG